MPFVALAPQGHQAKERGDAGRSYALLDETIRIETEQMNTEDPKQLRGYLDEVTRIKLGALDELTDEDLRGDQMFTIFLTQYSNLSKLQLKINLPSGWKM